MSDPANALAELMNQRHGNLAADPSLGASRQRLTVINEPPAAEDALQSGSPAENSAHSATAAVDHTEHTESIAALVCELLGARVKPWLKRKLQAWPYVLEDADDLGQLAALAFVQGYRQGKVKPDPATQRHTASSVSAYLWGICNHIFIDTLRRNRHLGEQQEVYPSDSSSSSQETSPLEKILLEAPEEDDESRLWAVLAAVRGRCRPQDIVTTYLLGCGFSSGEVRRLLKISINMPSIAIKRVGRAVKELLDLDPASQPQELPATGRNPHAGSLGVSPDTSMSSSSSPLSTLGLLLQKSFSELIQRLDSPPARNMFLREAVAALGPAEHVTVEQSLADRQYAVRASGDWSWGLLSAAERRELLTRNAKLLHGAGIPDGGAAQRAALEELVSDLGDIFEEFDKALLGDDLNWLLPLAEHLARLLAMFSEFKEMGQRYRHLLKAARRLRSPRLEMMAQIGLGAALMSFGQDSEARDSLERAARLARELNEPRGEARAIYNLACVSGHMGRNYRAKELFEQCLSICRLIGDRTGEASALIGLAISQHSLGEYDGTEELLSQALGIMREVGNRRGESYVLGELAMYHQELGEYDITAKLHSQALDIRRELGDRHGEAGSLINFAILHKWMGNYMQSAEMCAQSLMLYRQLGDRRGETWALSDLAALHCSQGEFHAAAGKLSKAIKISQEIGDRASEALALANLSELHLAQGDYARATGVSRRALDIYIALGDSSGEAGALCGLARIHTAQNELERARDLYLQGLSLYAEIGLKVRTCMECAFASVCLALLGALRQAAVSFYGAIHHATMFKTTFDQNEQKSLNQAKCRLEAAVESGEITAGELADWRADGESLSLDDLAQYVLRALRG